MSELEDYKRVHAAFETLVQSFMALVPPVPDENDEEYGIKIYKLFELRNQARAMFPTLDPHPKEGSVEALREVLAQMTWTKHSIAVERTQDYPELFQRALKKILSHLLRMIPHEKCTGLHRRRAVRAAQIIRRLAPDLLLEVVKEPGKIDEEFL